MRIVIEILLFYIAYKIIFSVIIPIYKISREIKKKSAEIKQQRDFEKTKTNVNTKLTKIKDEGEYIDYEEIKNK